MKMYLGLVYAEGLPYFKLLVYVLVQTLITTISYNWCQH